MISVRAVYTQVLNSDLRQELDEIKYNQQAIQKDLSEIKVLLSRLLGASPSQNTIQKPVPLIRYEMGVIRHPIS